MAAVRAPGAARASRSQVPADQTCCGQPAYNAGFHDEARAVARHTLRVLAATEGPIVIPSGSCADMVDPPVRGPLRATSRSGGPRARRGRARARAQPVPGRGPCRGGAVRRAWRRRVAYHPSCHLSRGLKVREAPQALLRDVAGAELVPFADQDECCGFGGRLLRQDAGDLRQHDGPEAGRGRGLRRRPARELRPRLPPAPGRRPAAARVEAPGPALRGGARRGAAVNAAHAAAVPGAGAHRPRRRRTCTWPWSRATGAARLAPRHRASPPSTTPSCIRDLARRTKMDLLRDLAVAPGALRGAAPGQRRARALGGGRRGRQPRRWSKIADAHGVQRVVKGKSMATEETHLNHALEGAGLHVVETDLGEYVVQLGARPPVAHHPAHHPPDVARTSAGACTRRSASPTATIPPRWPATRGRSCARSSCARTWGSPGPTSAWSENGHHLPSSPTRATAAWCRRCRACTW